MKQVFVSGKGEIEVLEAPAPRCPAPGVLVRNAFSLISSGTEGAAVSSRGGWMGVFEKAMKSRDRAQQIIRMAQTHGVSETWQTVQRKLAGLAPLGYSSAGMVMEVSPQDGPLRPGDLVACVGAGVATHSEYVGVPINLVERLPKGMACAEAAFGAVACIAMQGIRRIEAPPGEWVGVIGLGLIGQIAAQLLTVMGYRAVGMDLLPERAALTRELAGIEAWGQGEAGLVQRVLELTEGRGLDGVVICAATQSDQPVNLAFDLCRKRGRVSIVGDIALNLSRSKMYRKEIELRMSCSYGPGRYDDDYELRGQDYPYPYVRWTEKRNLRYALDLINQKRLNVARLISSQFPPDEALNAFSLVKRALPGVYGVLFDYGPLPRAPRPLSREEFTVTRGKNRASARRVRRSGQGPVRLGVIGCGGFAKAVHLPNLARMSDTFELVGTASRTGAQAAVSANRFGAAFSTSRYEELLRNPDIEAVLIATRHDDHATLALEALKAGKHVFVEKPMCLRVEEGHAIVAEADASGLVVRVGFNRRFAPYLQALRRAVGNQGRRMFSIRVNVGQIEGHWSNTAEQGGRFLGEGVHFLDLCNWFAGEEPEAVHGVVGGPIEKTNPNIAAHMRYANGCVAQLLYTSLGSAKAGKERYEAFGAGRAAICEDFRALYLHGGGAVARGGRGDKGHRGELVEFAAAVRGRTRPIKGADARAGMAATRMALAVYEGTLDTWE